MAIFPQAEAPFTWGQGGQRMTPEQVERQRVLAALMQREASDTSPVAHWTAGLNRALQGYLSGRQAYQAGQAEEAGIAGAQERIQNDPVLAALMGGQTMASDALTGGATGGTPGMTPATMPSGATADAVRSGLIARGLPDHIADAFILNFQDESGLNPGINEVAPIVPNSRGGFGLAQWTGPRRVALEEFAAQRGTPVSDLDTQLDFLMTELQGPEAGAAQAIMSARDTPTAAAEILNQFLRPAESHRARREAAYLGGDFGTPSQAPSNVVAALASAQADPWVARQYGPVIDALMKQEMGRQDAAYQQQLRQQDPAYQLGLDKLGLEVEAMRNPVVDPFAGTQVINNQLVGMGDEGPQVLGDFNTPEQTAAMQNYEYLVGQGVDPETALERAFSGGVNVNVGGEGMPGLGNLSTDYGYIMDPETGQPRIDPETGMAQSAPVPGSPAARALEEAEAAAAAGQRNARDYARTVTQDIGIADEYLGSLGPIVGADNMAAANLRVARSNIPGTPEYSMRQFVESALSNVTLDTMNRMREASAAGATGFGNMSERQMKVIQGVLGQWDPGLPVEDQRMILHRLGNFYMDVQVGTKEERAEAVRDGRMTAEENAEIEAMYYPETRDGRGRRVEGDARTDPEMAPNPVGQRRRYNPQTGAFE